MKYLTLILKNIRRNPLRTLLTAMGTMMLVCVVTLIWSVLSFLDRQTSEKSQNLKLIVTERWQLPSQMPLSYADILSKGAPREPNDLTIADRDSMTWQFFGGSTEEDPRNRSPDSILFAFALEPPKLATMMDELDELGGSVAAEFQRVVDKLAANRQGLVVGQSRLDLLKQKVGGRLTLFSLNYPGIKLDLEIVGTFPPGRYDLSAAIHRDYLSSAMDQYERETGRRHPMIDRTLNLVWLRVKDRQEMAQVAQQIESSPQFRNPQVKVETASSGIAAFLEAYRTLIWGMRWLLMPAIITVLAVIIANAISISVRERRTELAVLKVLGFRPNQLLCLVVMEALAIGVSAGLSSALATYLLINLGFGGVTFPIAFFSKFFIPWEAVVLGTIVGAGTALAGSVVPAWSARSVKVSEVFAKVA
ncbi:MAG: ABC transporter permease [Planctomycetes bacterium]|nr:ABC transporter permease [Planctomycetota bacterium]